MPKVLITRSEPGASQLAQLLQQHGFDVISAPLVEIVDVTPPNILQLGEEPAALPAVPVTGPDVMIFLSAHASRRFVAEGLLPRTQMSACLAVGEATAGILRERGVIVDVPEQNTTEGLLEMQAIKQLCAQHCVWLISGVGGRTTLAESLIRVCGCSVVKFELYQRFNLDLPVVDVDAVDVAVVSSEASLEVLAQQWRGSKKVVVVVPSTRLAARTQAAGFQNVQVSQNASAQATLDILQPLMASKRLQ